MGAEEATQLVNELVFTVTGKYLADNQREVFQRSFQGETYREMADVMHLEPETVKDIGFELWNLLSEVLGEKVTKKNFRAALERAKALRQESCSSVSPVSQQVEAIQERVDLAEAVDDVGFVGRGEALVNLNSLVSQGAKMILIHATGGVGKSKLAYRYLKTQGFDVVLELWMAKETQDITSAESVVEEWLRRYLDEEPGREFGVSLERLRQKLREPSRRIGVLIDNLEPAVDQDGKFIETQRSYVELLRVLTDPDSKAVTLITSRERLRESAVTPQVYFLEGLDESAWQQFFACRGIQVDVPSLNAMHKTYAGNAKAMEILASTVQSDFGGNLTAYWQVNQHDFLVERDLEDIVVSQFNRLQRLDSDSYKLLCRLGCYRYQDVPNVPIDGLFCMLWNVPEKQQKRTIKSLQDRALINYENGFYWLHPVIREEAIRRLRISDDWTQANQVASELWTNKIKIIETLEDAMMAFEAYYHYIQMEDYSGAASVILRQRDNRWEEQESLGRSLYRLGLLALVENAIHSVINRIEDSKFLCRLFNILGDISWSRGIQREAIKYHKKSGEIASNIEEWEYIALLHLNLAQCKIELLELTDAEKDLEEVSKLIKRISIEYISLEYQCCMAFVKSINQPEEAKAFLMEARQHLTERYEKGSKLTAWTVGFGFVFLGGAFKNLDNLDLSEEMYNRAVDFADQSHYLHVKAKAFIGLGDLCRKKNMFQESLNFFSQSISLLERIGGIYDLAEVYFQLGLTYKTIGEATESNMSFQKSLQLFSQMDAPNQVERVKQEMNKG